MFLLFSVQALWAQTRTWTGATSSAWSTSSNWSGGNVPGAGENVVINSGTFAPDFNTTLTINNLTIGNWGPEAPLNVNGGTLTVTGSITLNGGGRLNVAGGTLNHTGTSFSFSFGSQVGVAVSAGLLVTNATNYTINSSMLMSGGEFRANAGFTVGSGKVFNQSAGKIVVNGHLNISSSNTNFILGSDSLIVNGRITLGTNTNFYGGQAKVVVNRQSGQNNQISGNWYTQQAEIVFNPSIPIGNNLTSISSSGAKFYAGQGTVLFNDSVFIGSNADLFADGGMVTFSRSLEVSSAGTVTNNAGTLNFEGNATFKSSGTLNAGSGQLNFGGDVVVDNSNGVINAGEATIVVQGNLTNAGTFNAGTSTVIFDGDSDQVISNDIVFYNLIIETSGSLTAGGNVTVLNDGVIGDNTTIVLDNNQLNVQGELTDNGGNLAVATNKPFVVSATTPLNTQIELVFNEKLNNTANTISNYSISPSRTISSAVLNDSIVKLTVTTALDATVEYTVTMNNIQNQSSVAVNPNHIKRVIANFAIAPGIQATGIVFDQIDTNKIRVKVSRGNGARVLVLAKSGTAVNGSPVNGTGYAANTTFGNGSQIGTGNFVVYAGTDSVFTLTALSTNTIYHFRAYEYNGTGSGSQYNLNNMPVGSRSTLASVPIQQATIVSKTAITATSMTLNFAAGSGNRRLVVLKAGTVVDTLPVQGSVYAANSNFSLAGEISSGNKVLYYNTGTSVNITGLSPGTKYFIRLFEANGNANGNDHYLYAAAAVDSFITPATEPSINASSPTFLVTDTTQLTLRVNKGNGSFRLVVVRQGAAVAVNPVDGQVYTGSTTFGAGDTLNADTYVVYSGSDSVFQLNGLQSGVMYHFRIFEFNGSAEATNYRTSSYLTTSRATLSSTPTQQVALGAFSNRSSSGFRVNWTPGNGSHRLVLVRANGPITVNPVDGVNYTASSTFGSGTLIGDSTYVVYLGTSTTQTGTLGGMLPASLYYVKVFEVNIGATGSNNYLLTNAPTDSVYTLSTLPSISASGLVVTAISATSMRLSWVKGNGEKTLVVGRQSANPAAPTNGVAYLADTNWTLGSITSASSYAVYADTGSSVIITGLSPNTNYRFRLYPFNGNSITAAYRTTLPAEISRNTLPATLSSNAVFDQIGPQSFRLNWQGGATGKLIVMRKEAPVSVYPSQGTNYTANAAFGSGAHLGDSNFVVFSATSNSVTLTNLEQNTTYHLAIFDYSGSDATRSYAFMPAIEASRFTFLRLDVKVFLQGPFNGDSMETKITAEIPLSQPYNNAPWNYNGNEQVVNLPNVPIVDWIYVQTRKSIDINLATSDSVTAEAVGWLRSDGRIVGLNGIDYLTMPINQPGNQYVVVYHRTHIPIMSNSTIVLDNEAYYFDFTSSQNQAYGSEPQQALPGGYWGMYSGRIEQTTPFLIDNADIQRVWLDKNLEGSYADADAVLEGLVDATDRSMVWNNRNRSSQVPE